MVVTAKIVEGADIKAWLRVYAPELAAVMSHVQFLNNHHDDTYDVGFSWKNSKGEKFSGVLKCSPSRGRGWHEITPAPDSLTALRVKVKMSLCV